MADTGGTVRTGCLLKVIAKLYICLIHGYKHMLLDERTNMGRPQGFTIRLRRGGWGVARNCVDARYVYSLN